MLPKSADRPYKSHALAPGNYGLSLVDTLRPSAPTKGLNLPNSRQCVGTNRLWGANLGAAAYLDLTSKKLDNTDLMDIAVLTRSFLVLKDHINDEYLPEDTLDYCNKWLGNINSALKSLYERIGEDFENHLSLCEKTKWIYENRILSEGFVNSYRSAVEAWSIFFMPYRLKPVAKDCINYPARVIFLESFFFCCQLLDDFHDIGEDTKKKTNHNVFLENVPREYWNPIKAHRANLLPGLLLLIKKNLCSSVITESVSGNEILEYYLKAGTWWINHKLTSFSGKISPSRLAELEFENFVFEKSFAMELLDSHGDCFSNQSLEDVRPEIFQTAYMGINHIDEV
jgi:hypothetical protein